MVRPGLAKVRGVGEGCAVQWGLFRLFCRWWQQPQGGQFPDESLPVILMGDECCACILKTISKIAGWLWQQPVRGLPSCTSC